MYHPGRCIATVRYAHYIFLQRRIIGHSHATHIIIPFQQRYNFIKIICPNRITFGIITCIEFIFCYIIHILNCWSHSQQYIWSPVIQLSFQKRHLVSFVPAPCATRYALPSGEYCIFFPKSTK